MEQVKFFLHQNSQMTGSAEKKSKKVLNHIVANSENRRKHRNDKHHFRILHLRNKWHFCAFSKNNDRNHPLNHHHHHHHHQKKKKE
jgi:hypothetical protein